jgi:scyllo-inositol 2-dehydrogenase (NADP+)
VTPAPAPDSGRRPIRVAVVGAGWVGTHRHMPVLHADRRFKLVGVVDRHAERAVAAAKEFGLEHIAVASSLAEVDWLDDIQAVTIATSPDAHGRLLAEARQFGRPVLTEKPFTLDFHDAEVAAAPSANVIAVMHNFQFARSAERLWSDLAAGRLGDIRSVDAIQLSNKARRLPEWFEELPLGLFFDESPHLLYLLRRVVPDATLKDLDVVHGQGGRRTPLLVRARYAGGGAAQIPVTLSMNFESAVSEWYLAVHGSRAVGVVDLFRDIYIRVPNDRSHTTSTVIRSSLAATLGHWSGYASSGVLHVTGRLRYGVDEVVARFAAAIDAGRDPEHCGRADALAVRLMQQEIIDAAGVGS